MTEGLEVCRGVARIVSTPAELQAVKIRGVTREPTRETITAGTPESQFRGADGRYCSWK